jgi:hypothetical protein
MIALLASQRGRWSSIRQPKLWGWQSGGAPVGGVVHPLAKANKPESRKAHRNASVAAASMLGSIVSLGGESHQAIVATGRRRSWGWREK